jgi:Protein of unknown function (DUF3465)
MFRSGKPVVHETSNAHIMRKLNGTIVRNIPRRALAKAVLIGTAVAVLAVIFVSCANHDPATEHRATPHDDSPIGRAFASGTSDVQVDGEGTVISILSDDVAGSRHQRFIVQLESGQTLLITHNIDLAPRIAGLKVADSVRFNGEYVWNEKGGVIHWTHHDPQGRHVAGWVIHNGKRYQ